jgi:hypothetical protein
LFAPDIDFDEIRPKPLPARNHAFRVRCPARCRTPLRGLLIVHKVESGGIPATASRGAELLAMAS